MLDIACHSGCSHAICRIRLLIGNYTKEHINTNDFGICGFVLQKRYSFQNSQIVNVAQFVAVKVFFVHLNLHEAHCCLPNTLTLTLTPAEPA